MFIWNIYVNGRKMKGFIIAADAMCARIKARAQFAVRIGELLQVSRFDLYAN